MDLGVLENCVISPFSPASFRPERPDAQMAAPFVAPSRPSTGWVSAGHASSFPDIAPGAGTLSEPHPCAAAHRPGCAVLHVPRTGGATPAATRIALDGGSPGGSKNLTDQVLVFRYRGKFHAVDHVRSFLFLIHFPRFSCAGLLMADTLHPSNARTRPSHCPKGRPLTSRTLASC